MGSFNDKIYKFLRAIPKGKVVTYGQIADVIGCPGAARAVGNALHKNPDPINTPCFKVVNASGCLAKNFAFGGIEKQAKMLENEGIIVKNNRVDLCKYKWDINIIDD